MRKLNVLLLVGCSVFTCAKPDLRPDPVTDYPAYVAWASRGICDRILFCFSSLARSVSPEKQKQITVANCSASALKDLDRKIALHTPSMRENSVKCYETLLEADCFDFGALVYWDPSCMMLRRETDEVYEELRKKAGG